MKLLSVMCDGAEEAAETLPPLLSETCRYHSDTSLQPPSCSRHIQLLSGLTLTSAAARQLHTENVELCQTVQAATTP